MNYKLLLWYPTNTNMQQLQLINLLITLQNIII